MDTSKKSFIRENVENGTGFDGLVDGLSFYVNRFLDVINEGNPMDIPIIVAALHHTEHVMRDFEAIQAAALRAAADRSDAGPVPGGLRGDPHGGPEGAAGQAPGDGGG